MLLLWLVSACRPVVAGVGGAEGPAPVVAAPPVAAPEAAPEAPPGLRCLAAVYGGTPERADQAWTLSVPGAPPLPWDDGRPKDPEARIAAPDLQDTLVPPYPHGAPQPVLDPAQDPGRARVEALFDAVYGGSAEQIQAHLVPVDFVGQTMRVHERVAPALARVSARLTAAIAADPGLAAFVTGPLGGTFNWRVVANTGRRSAHSWGIAVDVATARSSYWEWDRAAGRPVTWTNHIPEAVVAAFEAESFAWGGRWYHYDSMHFEYRPELFTAGCTG